MYLYIFDIVLLKKIRNSLIRGEGWGGYGRMVKKNVSVLSNYFQKFSLYTFIRHTSGMELVLVKTIISELIFFSTIQRHLGLGHWPT